jgi:hypothetical protein
MKLCQAARFVFALVCCIVLAGFLKVANVAAQSNESRPEESVPTQLSAVDQIAAEDASAQQHVRIHLHPQRSLAARRTAFAQNRENRTTLANNSADSESSASIARSIPSFAGPGFYPADLSDPFHGKVLTSVRSHNIYVNCAASCWGNPSIFLANLALSYFIHITDEYVGATAGYRYTVGAASSINPNPPLHATLQQSDILGLVHAAARTHGSDYGHVYHLFLPRGTDVCLSAKVCYSPNNSSTFVFCAYHGSADYADIGHVLFTVEPYQNVPGCSVAQPSPNGALVDSTASTLSHELIETITDPDGDAWLAQNSLLDYNYEIGDLCETPFGNYAAFKLYTKSYAIQPEYSNKYHACATTP